MYTKEQIGLLVAECNDLRQKQADLLGRIDLLNSRLQEMLNQEERASATALNLEDLMASLKDSESDVQDAIIDAIYHLDSSELEELIEVYLSLSGNEIETELSIRNRWKIEQFVRDYISTQVMEKLEMGIAHYFENLTPKANDTI